MVIGKIGTGKTTLINNIIGKDILKAKFSFSRVTHLTEQITGKLTLGQVTYDINFIDTIGLSDAVGAPSSSDNFTNPQIIESIKIAIKERFKDGLSLVIITLNLQSYTKDDKDMFKILESNFKPLFWQLAILVFTHSDGMVEREVEQRVQSFKNDEQTRAIASKFEGRIITVGFPSLEIIKEDFKESLKRDMERDVQKLHEYIKIAVTTQPYDEVVNTVVVKTAVHKRSCCVM